jgi:cell envelope opacity-associated protein A
MNEKIKLELSLEDTNALLANLGTLPYQNVFSLIKQIQEQGAPQAEEIMKAREEAKKTEETEAE